MFTCLASCRLGLRPPRQQLAELQYYTSSNCAQAWEVGKTEVRVAGKCCFHEVSQLVASQRARLASAPAAHASMAGYESTPASSQTALKDPDDGVEDDVRPPRIHERCQAEHSLLLSACVRVGLHGTCKDSCKAV